MGKNTTWKQIGAMRVLKWTCFVCFLILLFSTLANLIFYFFPNLLTNYSILYTGYENLISSYALYVAICTGITCVFTFCGYKYTADKLDEIQETNKKTSPDTMKELVNFAKEYNRIISEINAATNLEEFEALKGCVDSYNDKAEKFAEENGVTPKLITVTDYNSKRKNFEL